MVGDDCRSRGRHQSFTSFSHPHHHLFSLCELLRGQVIESDTFGEGSSDSVLHVGCQPSLSRDRLVAGCGVGGGCGFTSDLVLAAGCPERTHADTIQSTIHREVGPGLPDPHPAIVSDVPGRPTRQHTVLAPVFRGRRQTGVRFAFFTRILLAGVSTTRRRFRAHREFRAIAPPTNEPRINDRIRAREVRLVGQDGEQIGIKPLSEALNIARATGLDLVEVADQARPPVCRIMDYGKFKYEADQRAKESR
ncbi:MAG: translation initiation factor IF-3, partial [Actinobacteria bacterium]|nr:translation initiation factor IF-3 [Actinomycetota bacterium]